MKKITAKTLQDALLLASEEFKCSVVDLEYEVAQNPSAGILGIGRKDAVIVVDYKKGDNETNNEADIAKKNDSKTSLKQVQNISTQPLHNTQQPPQKDLVEHNQDDIEINKKEQYKETYVDFNENLWGDIGWGKQEVSYSKDIAKNPPQSPKDSKDSVIVSPESPKSALNIEEFDKETVAKGIERELKELFSYLPFEIDHIKVVFVDSELYITIDGRDCALLIGEKGYRYKALSYLLFNWINPKYGVSVRLEVAEFLKNQEQMIDAYLEGIVEQVNMTSRAQTKPLDGILAYIALGKLREIFPQKYVSFRLNEEGEKYIIINDFKKS